MVNLRSTSGWDRSGSLGHPSQFQRVSRLGSVTARYSSSGRQPNFAALNRGRHLYSAGRPSRWSLAHILVLTVSLWYHFVDIMTYLWTCEHFNGYSAMYPRWYATDNVYCQLLQATLKRWLHAMTQSLRPTSWRLLRLSQSAVGL